MSQEIVTESPGAPSHRSGAEPPPQVARAPDAFTVLAVGGPHGAGARLAKQLAEAGFRVIPAASGEHAWRGFRKQVCHAVVVDGDLGDGEALALMRRVRAHSEIPVLAWSSRATVETAVAALKAGADDFVSLVSVETGTLAQRLGELLAHASAVDEPAALERRLIGSSSGMAAVRTRIHGVAPLRVPVLVAGESGTGRTTVVEAIHDMGSTAQYAIQHFDAARFEPKQPLPVRGTIHLRGVEQLGSDAQRFWADWLGRAQARGFEDMPRVIASTACRPGAHDAAPALRPRLAELLGRFVIELPPLRERSADIPALAEALVARIAPVIGRQPVRLAADASDRLASLPWPGNVRELAQLLERAMAFSRQPEITRDTLDELVSEATPSIATIRARERDRERAELLEAIRETGGNVTRTAERMGRSRAAVYRLIARHGVSLTDRERG